MSTALPADNSVHGAGAATRLIIAASVGNALEFYEILVYGYFALVVSKVFFPAASEAMSLLVTYGTFGISFLARPVGAIFLGAYGDRKGRKAALTLSIFLMTLGTALMTIMPSYATFGLLAPILVVAARLLQGFSVGGEFASSTAFLVEHRPDRSGFFASWQWSSQGLAALIATGLGVLLTSTMSAEDLQSFGWRIPFAVGLLIGPIGYYIRNRLPETPEFLSAGEAQAPLRDLFTGQWDRLLLTIGAVAASTSSQYVLVYMPTYAIRELHLPQSVSFTAAVAAAALQTVVVPFVGLSVDKVGQIRIMLVAALLFVLTSYLAFMLVAGHPSFAMLMAVVCWFGFLKSLFSGALPSLMAKVFPVGTRVTGMSLAYNIGVPIFGGFAPLAAQSLIDITGSKLSPSYYMVATAAISFVALIALRRRYKV
ncbi:MAG TPA: MFS transporter [Xanthobacteraceae bacterium]|jgi:MHS family proline/betaine transporter-like MFS transporter|nr:MFS transporter [Xanthobacteraceae bacterium]